MLMSKPTRGVPGLRKAAWMVQQRVAVARATRRGAFFYRQWVRRGSLCFDVGANVGNRTRIFLALGARVVAVEPQPACVTSLRRIRRRRLVIEEVALGATPGTAQLHVASASTISSMADEWIERVKASGRFSDYEWRQTLEVEVMTLDALIVQYGVPDFCKIDVEGYESQVLAGLSRTLPVLSFEFTPEWSESAEKALARLESLGFAEFNFSAGESLQLVWREWRDCDSMREYLAALPRDGCLFGDVYARVARL